MMRSRTVARISGALIAVALVAGVVAVPVGSASALTGPAGITRVSISSAGVTADFEAPGFSPPAVSTDGRYIAFDSWASNLAANSEDGGVFVRDTTGGTTTSAAVRMDGTSDDAADSPAISGDGRFVAFASDSTGLVTGGNSNFVQIFLRDRTAGTTTRISTKPNGAQATDESASPSINSDGRFVAYESDSPGLVTGDLNEWTDVFVRDRTLNTTKRVSLTNAGAEAELGGESPSISGDGRFVAFLSHEQMVPQDTDTFRDVYVRDQVLMTTTRVSVTNAGAASNGGSGEPHISQNGRYVVFTSSATNLDGQPDTNNANDVFVRDLIGGTTQRVSRNAAGGLANGTPSGPTISGDGRFVSYESTAPDAVTDDTNGAPDAFVFDRQTSTTSRVSTDQLGQQLATGGIRPVITPTGTYVTFSTGSPISGLGSPAYRQLYVRLTVPLGTGVALPELSVGNASVVEGNASTRQLRFTVTVSKPSAAATSVAYSTASGTATSGNDFNAKSGILTVPAGATSALIAVPVRGDQVGEGNENFTVTLSNPQSAVLRRATGTGTITNDDSVTGTAVRVSVGNASLVEGDSTARVLRFAVTLSAASPTATKVNYATVLGTANGTDITAKSGTLNVAKNVTSALVSISVKADEGIEPNETFKVKLSTPVGASIQFGTGTGTILNDD